MVKIYTKTRYLPWLNTCLSRGTRVNSIDKCTTRKIESKICCRFYSAEKVIGRERLRTTRAVSKDEMTKINRNSSFITGILAILCYLAYTVLAYSRYPFSYSPTSNWLSDLGNPNNNPQGAIFYNIGIISTALLLIVFFMGLSLWKIEDNRVQIIMLRLVQAFGILGAFCMMMSAIWPINLYKIHSFWSSSLYVMLSTAFIFSVAMLRYHHKVPRWLLILGVSTALMVILTSFFPDIYMLEWITVFLFLSYISVLGIETKMV